MTEENCPGVPATIVGPMIVEAMIANLLVDVELPVATNLVFVEEAEKYAMLCLDMTLADPVDWNAND